MNAQHVTYRAIAGMRCTHDIAKWPFHFTAIDQTFTVDTPNEIFLSGSLYHILNSSKQHLRPSCANLRS